MREAQTSLRLFQESRLYVKGKLLHEIFHNPENLYTVSKIKVTECTEDIDDKTLTVVGQYPPLLQGEIYTFWGKLKHHPRFGLQYELDYYRKDMPQGRDGLIQYLSSDLFPGIGKGLATRIVETLGQEAIPLILENPDVLQEVRGIPQKAKQTLRERLMEYQGLEQIMVKLSEYGIGLALSVQIYQTYAERAMEILQENPYRLIEDVQGIGFSRADAIARAMGVAFDAPERIRAACTYYLWEQAERNGHVYVPQQEFLSGTREWLNRKNEEQLRLEELHQDSEDREADDGRKADPLSGAAERFDHHSQKKPAELDKDDIARHMLEMGEEGKLIMEDERIYLPSLFYAERGFAKKVRQLLEHDQTDEISQQELYAALGELEEKWGIEYAPSQKEAIETALRSSLMILTGGPGTGKTTVIRGICEVYARLYDLSLDPKDYAGKEEAFPVILIAPTGRAAKRMEESTGLPAVTIHRLLGWQGGQSFEHTEDEPISGKLLVVDEVSMMDQWLANQLFRTLPEGMQVILVGDEDQLPSVGPGQVLKDLLASEQVPVVQLTDIFRQASDSSIITLAHQMKEGRFPDDLHRDLTDRRFFTASSTQIKKVVNQVCASALRRGYTPKDIQVLAPMYKGEAGIDALNAALQDTFNPAAANKRQLQFKEHTFRIGDKVLQLVNNPEENVFNGDIGQVEAIIYAKENTEKEEQMVVRFDSTEVTYRRTDFGQLTLAYCISVHKSQGSEFPIVVLPVVKAYYRMLQRNLIYTGITRGKDYLILCGEEKALRMAIDRQDVTERYTSLQDVLT